MTVWKFEENAIIVANPRLMRHHCFPFNVCDSTWTVTAIMQTEHEGLNIIVKPTGVVVLDNLLLEVSVTESTTNGNFNPNAVSAISLTKEFKSNMDLVEFFFRNYKWENTDPSFNIKVTFYKGFSLPKAEVSKTKEEQEPMTVSKDKYDSEAGSDTDLFNEFCNNVSQFQQKELYTDVTLRCGKEIFKGHRVILSARSPVFHDMLQNPTRETLTQEIEIEEMKPEVFHYIMAYIYSNKIIEESASINFVTDILTAAEKYELKELKKSFLIKLRRFVTVANALTFLIIANSYDVTLKNYVVDFICKEYDAVSNSPEWLRLQKEKPLLILEIMEEYLKE